MLPTHSALVSGSEQPQYLFIPDSGFLFMLKCFSLRRLFVVVFISFLSTGCNEKQISAEPEIVARVGERTITAREFQLNYEFGFSSLKKTPNRKLSYLESMINELMLSLEGYRLGLDKTERVQKLEADLLQELLIEEHLRTQVTETIAVSDEEIRDAITGSKVRWKFRYWTETNLAAAELVYELMLEQGYANVVAERLALEEIRRDPRDLETGYLTWLETPAELLQAIKDLQIGELSKPIALDDNFFLIQIIDIRREAIAEYDYEYLYNRYEQILFQRRLKDATSRYITGFMTAKNVVVKGDAFQILLEALVEWKRQDDKTRTFSDAIEDALQTEPALQKLDRNSGKVLITFKGGRWSLKEFIARIDPARLKITPGAKQQFHAHLKREIALTLRNDLLAKEAISEELHESESIQNQLRAWRDKWVYQEIRRQYLTQNDLDSPLSDLTDSTGSVLHLKQTRSLLDQKLELLRKTNTVRIYEAVLETVSVTDFKKSRWADVFLFKNSSKRPAIPIVDPVFRL